MESKIEIRECITLEELSQCVDLQRSVFSLPEVELSPVRHFVVTKNAGGFILGAYDGTRLIGFVLSVPAFLRGEKAFYSHMTAVDGGYQSLGIGGRLKWAQRDRALDLGVRYVKWTFEPWKARNAFFNLEKLGATIREYQRNFYGTDYATTKEIGLASDRLFAEWDLESEKVVKIADGTGIEKDNGYVLEIEVPNDWTSLVNEDPEKALAEQLRIRAEFESAFEKGLVVRSFFRDSQHPKYLLYSS